MKHWFIAAVSPLLLGFPCAAQSPGETVVAENQVLQGLESSFSFPLSDWLQARTDGKNEHPWNGFSIAPRFNYPLFKVQVPGSQGVGDQGQEAAATPTITVSAKYNPITYWFVETTFYAYLDPKKQAPWNPDFSYSFGYDDWHPYTLSLVYSNYGGNRFHPRTIPPQPFTVFPEGTFTLGWKFQLPQRIEDALKLTSASSMGWSVGYSLTPRYTDAKTLVETGPKHAISFSYRNQFISRFYFNVTMYEYPLAGQEQPWNPDFTYGFGYFDYRPGHFSIAYNNYSGNRFPWKALSPGTGRFSNGAVSLSWSWGWAQ